MKKNACEFFGFNSAWLLALALLSSCGTYRNRTMFTTDDTLTPQVASAVAQAHANYSIQQHDYLEVDVYTNGGELIIDPNQEIVRAFGTGGNVAQTREKPQFLVREDGYAKLPLIGEIKLAGLTLHQADSLLESAYAAYYEGAFVITRYANKRVVVLGATGGQVIPLQNEDMNLLEVLALAGGISPQAKTNNIRLIRGDLAHPEVHLIDLSTIEGMRKSSLKVLSGDVIYVEPVQRLTAEAIRDISPILGLVTSLLTLALLIGRL